MIRFLAVFFISVSITFGQIRIDASSQEALQKSYEKLIASLDVDEQQQFALAMTIIGVAMSQRADLGGSAKIMKIIDGKTAKEIIEESKKFTAFAQNSQTIIKANTKEEFSTSVGNILVSLPEKKRGEFSEAIAKLIYEMEQKKTPESDFLKRVNDKSVDDIIEIGKTINLPFFSTNQRDNLDYSIEEVSHEKLKKLGIDTRKKQKTSNEIEVLDFRESLVPSE